MTYRTPNLRFQAAASFATLLLTGVAGAQFIPGQYITTPALTGETHYDGWLAQSVQVGDDTVWQSTLSSAYNPGYPGFFNSTTPWPSPIASKQGSTGHDAELSRISGGAYPASSSLYFASGGMLSVSDATPLNDLANIVFQLELGEAAGDDFANDALPVLSYNGGSQPLLPDYSAITRAIDNGQFTPPGETESSTLYINTWLMQWDLSSLGPVTDFAIEFSAVTHAALYAMRVDQSDTFTAVPEPAALGLAGIPAILLFRRRRRTP